MSNPFSEYCPKCDANHAAGDCLAWLRKQYHDLRSRLSAAEEELQGWKNAASVGHSTPCNLGSLCPYCEIERLQSRAEKAQAEGDSLKKEIQSLDADMTETLRDWYNSNKKIKLKIQEIQRANVGQDGETLIDRIEELALEALKALGSLIYTPKGGES